MTPQHDSCDATWCRASDDDDAYGRLIYNKVGPSAEEAFTRAWGVGIGLGQAQDVRALLISAAEAALVLTILEALWLLQNSSWLERYVDFLSIYRAALVPPGGAARGQPPPPGGCCARGTRGVWSLCQRFWRFSAALSS